MSEIDLLRELVMRDIEAAVAPLRERIAATEIAVSVHTADIAALRVVEPAAPEPPVEAVVEAVEDVTPPAAPDEAPDADEDEDEDAGDEDEPESEDEAAVIREITEINDEIAEAVADEARPERTDFLHRRLFARRED